MIKRLLLIGTLGVMLSGCFMAPMALIGPATSGFSTASLIQSSVTTGANYVVKQSTGKTITEHAISSINKDVLQQTYLPEDTKVNKDMKLLIKRFYNILINTEMYKNNDTKKKVNFLSTYLDKISLDKNINITGLVDYFNKYQAFCFDLSPDSVLKGNFNFNYKQRL